ncbi:MAG: sulfite exporter TauE/SafE family protein [Betaproteobacteria bacterium]|nr:sulfite exporter TauE/SafE family protein [Betaproteobacteria bacterium]MDH3438562.1 sulfite exporter TauE/SafE family protein [Betaproteobacteria bacterium]
MPSIVIIVVAPLTVLGAYVIFGISGFGSTLIAIPLLAHVFPLKFAVPVVVLLDATASYSQGFRLREGVNKRDVLPMLPFLVAGMLIGVSILVSVPGEFLLPTLGAFITAYGIYYAVKRESAFRFGRWMAAPFGLLGGTTSSVFGVGGPFYVMYLVGRGSTPEQIRATMPVVFMVTTVGRILLFSLAGLMTKDVLVTAALLLPVMAIGLWCGNRLHLNISRDHAARVIGTLLTLSGVSLLLRSL